jgi:predicted transposase/invertase (TIGR01784 family)
MLPAVKKEKGMEDITDPKNHPLLKNKVFLDPRYDTAFKLLFKEKRFLQHFLNGVLYRENENRIIDLEYRDSEVLSGFIETMKMARFDIVAKLENGEHIHIEMQQAPHAHRHDRALFYNAMLLFHAKKEWNEKHLEKNEFSYQIPKIISLWVYNFSASRENNDFHTSWSLYNDKDVSRGENALPATDLVKYIFLELPKFTKRLDELKSSEDRWLYLLSNIGESQSPPVMQDKLLDDALDKIRILNVNDHVLSEQVQSMISLADINDSKKYAREMGLAEGKAEGRTEGLAEGLAEGRIEGELKGKREMAKGLLADGVPVSIVAKNSGLSEEEILALK